MAKKQSSTKDPVVQRLDAIHSVLQDLFIIHAKLAGIRKTEARTIVGLGDARVTRIWRAVKAPDQE